MGNISSRQATNLIDGFVLRLARTIDSILRTINRKLSTISSFFFSRVFGYDVVFTDDSAPCAPHGGTSGDPAQGLMCQGNVCIVPASRIQQRQMEKKRRSERRRRAEAAALGEGLLRKHHREKEGGGGLYAKVGSVPSSPVVEKDRDRQRIMESLGPVARAPAPRPVEERETVGERERGKLWVMGNVQPRNTPVSQTPVQHTAMAVAESIPSSPVGDKTIDERVLQRMQDQRASSSATIAVKTRIQPRKSSKPPPLNLAAKIDPVAEKDETSAEGNFAAVHLTTRKDGPAPVRALHAPTALRLPPGALSLGPSPWEPSFRHPFTPDHEPVIALTSKAKQQLRQQYRPKLSLDTHLETSPLPHAAAAFIASPLSLSDEGEGEDSYDSTAILNLGTGISRPPSTASNHRARTPGMARKSIDAISLRSVDSSAHGGADRVIDVKTLANKAVKEEKGRKVWKDEVNKFAMQRCLLQQQAGACEPGRRFSTATLAGAASDKALTRVRTQEGEPVGLLGNNAGIKGRRGSSPALNLGMGMVSGRSTPVLRAESPLHAVMR
ncbi:uncharacterized protein UTRI_10500_B [Ustilago trichophora]|uniref:Uncharacterized protein n=1 Tax=Ustilago trichophora TaxID=86804 RepID=A0A5C3ECZ5_9BASI|nr:uncharacterized protein UTRI_10500_B [Ustilago trichophora]